MSEIDKEEDLLEKNQALCFQLQQNRRLVANSLSVNKMGAAHNRFPRSMTMRFLTERPEEKLIAAVIIARIFKKGKMVHSLIKLFHLKKESINTRQ